MTYRVLARKYRPRTFAEVMGQDHIVTALSRALQRDRLAQAYLLVGPRGVGKTSTARILAKSLNCDQGPTLDPCLQCDPCREIELGGNVDVVEIDGASNNGVDDVRGIRDRVHYRPMRDRFKIFIIDEVQRLSGPAFDALLKTLEEPPGHALFLFATTDPHKIPETIVSRCQVFEFRRLREVDIQNKLAQICQAENLEAEAEVLAAVARGCRGGLRDAESMLDQLFAAAEGAPTLDDLEMIAGLARPERWLSLFEAVEQDQPQAILQSVEGFLARGGTERDFVEQGVEAIRDLLHLILLGEDARGVEPAPEWRSRQLALAKAFGRDRLESLLGMLFALEGRMNQAPLAARALLEWTLLRAARLSRLLETGRWLQGLETSVVPEASPSAAAAQVTGSRTPTTSPATGAGRQASPEPAPPSPTPAQKPNLPALLKQVRRHSSTIADLLEDRVIECRFHLGENGPDGLQWLLRPLTAQDREMLEDPMEKRALADLPGSPGPWHFVEDQGPQKPIDPIGDQLRETFGGTEEVP
ncbi:MAG: DNA polymerase III subunit gamma/tau [Planctomycetota bacterium]|nr:MAG: DNA polymerase III subunit gamma/tau [Planctomycetota bacterium]